MSRPELLLTIAGSLHFLQIPSTSYLARRLLELGPDLAKLRPINQRIVRIFIVAASILILGLGMIVISNAPEVARTPLGHALEVLLVAFWGARAAAQVALRSVWPRDSHGGVWYFALLAIYLTVACCFCPGLRHC